jgi:hypothetical protein
MRTDRRSEAAILIAVVQGCGRANISLAIPHLKLHKPYSTQGAIMWTQIQPRNQAAGYVNELNGVQWQRTENIELSGPVKVSCLCGYLPLT